MNNEAALLELAKSIVAICSHRNKEEIFAMDIGIPTKNGKGIETWRVSAVKYKQTTKVEKRKENDEHDNAN
mgnify:CR=1 FL=1